jgi:hypothetical protein
VFGDPGLFGRFGFPPVHPASRPDATGPAPN